MEQLAEPKKVAKGEAAAKMGKVEMVAVRTGIVVRIPNNDPAI